MNDLAEYVTEWRQRKGFHTPNSIEGDNGKFMLGKLMLAVGELSEAAEAVRNNDLANFEEELADTIIRILDIVGTCKLDIDKAILEKMKVNENRPIKHGRASDA